MGTSICLILPSHTWNIYKSLTRVQQRNTPSSVQIRRPQGVLTCHATHVLQHIAFRTRNPCEQLAKCTFDCARWQGCCATNAIEQQARTCVRPGQHTSCHKRTLGAVQRLGSCTNPQSTRSCGSQSAISTCAKLHGYFYRCITLHPTRCHA